MSLENLLNHTSEWLRGTGPNSNIIISSRIRSARNLVDIPFSHGANSKQSEKSLDEIKAAVDSALFLKKSTYLELKDYSELDKQFLVERHLMSKEHAVTQESKGLVIDEKEIVSIMINEEDHIRMQVMQSGFNLTEAWRITNEIDKYLPQKFRIRYHAAAAIEEDPDYRKYTQ